MEKTLDEKQAVTASCIMPELPDAGMPELSSEDRLIVLLASAAQEGGRLSPESWKLATDAFITVFSPETENLSEAARREEEHRFFELQTRFHAALLKDPLSPEQLEADRRLSEDLAALSPERCEALVAAVQRLSPAFAAVLCRALSEDVAGRRRVMESLGRTVRLLPGVAAWESLFGDENGEKDAHGVVMEGGVAQRRPQPKPLLSPALRRQLATLSTMLSEAGAACTGVASSAASSAASQYEGAARYLRELNVQRMFSLFSPARRDMVIAPGFEDAAKRAEALEMAVLENGDMETARALGDFRHLMAEQPFTMVVVGEGKRGKSSLVNALLGGEYSPVRESVPETAAVARFCWGREFSGRVRFLSGEECARLVECFGGRDDREELCERLEVLRRQLPPRDDEVLSSPGQLREFLSAHEKGSFFASRVEAHLPSDTLKHGLVLVDTPGLNATDPVQNYLAFEECLAADCLLFVMDARRPESSSEQELLRQLARSGRAAAVIGVVTGADRLNEQKSRKSAMERARLLMDTASSCGMKVLGLLEVNAREAMQQRCSRPRRSGGQDFQKLCALVERAAAEKNAGAEEHEARLRSRGAQIVEDVRKAAEAFRARELGRLPDERHEKILGAHVARLEEAMNNCSSQAWSVVNAASVDMEAWRKEQERALDGWQENIVLRIMDAANRHADALGYTGMFRQKNWKKFDEEEVPRIARESLEELLAGRRDVQRDWNEKLRQFGERMREISVLCLDAVSVDDEELRSMGDVPFGRERWLVNANSVMKKVGLVAVGLALRRGGGVGLGIVLGNMGWWAVLPVAVVGSVVWTLMKLGSPSRCRRIFMERKEEAVRRWVTGQRGRLEELLTQNLDDLTSAYGRAVSEGFVPALAVLAEETAAMRAYLDVLKKMRAGVQTRTKETLRLAADMERALALPQS
ncbi:dynamin family protein [uncultured Mailhella sp.]|uniref:dynamin family protein n=1 Tax=uncultured Mailhella sp. TaxID=1981031 RepID=UPI0025F4B50F|nr:dynamin family protein [uncultured Mailhella sp.]